MMYELLFVLKNIHKFNWFDALFLPEDEVWDKNTKGMVLDSDDVEEGDDFPKEAQKRKLMYVLGIQEIQAIMQNANQQKQNLSEGELVEAFLFYYDNDAYIDFFE